MKKLKYQKGVAVIVNRWIENYGEYHQNKSQYDVEVRIKTQAAVKRVAALLGEFMITKEDVKFYCEVLKSKRQEYVVLQLRLNDSNLIEEYGCWYRPSGVMLDYSNDYSDEHYTIRIPTTKKGLEKSIKDPEFKRLYKWAAYGSCADGVSLKELIDRYSKSKNVMKI